LLTTLLGLFAIAINLLAESPGCPDMEIKGVTRVVDECGAFDVGISAAGMLGVVQREDRQVRIYDLSNAAGQMPRVAFRHTLKDAHPEEVFVLPEDGAFLFSAIPMTRSAEQTRLMLVHPGSWEMKVHHFAELCWISSTLWDPLRKRILFGCEDLARIFSLDLRNNKLAREADFFAEDLLGVVTDAQTSDPTEGDGKEDGQEGEEDVPDEPGTADEPLGDIEDMWIDEASSRLFMVSLVHDRLLAADLRTLQLIQTRRIGGFNYSVVVDSPRRRIYISRFYDSSLLVLDAADLSIVDSIRTGLGTRSLVLLRQQRLLVASSMFHNQLLFVSLEQGRVVRRLRLGGRIKSLTLDPSQRHLYASSSCGTFRVDLQSVIKKP